MPACTEIDNLGASVPRLLQAHAFLRDHAETKSAVGPSDVLCNPTHVTHRAVVRVRDTCPAQTPADHCQPPAFNATTAKLAPIDSPARPAAYLETRR